MRLHCWQRGTVGGCSRPCGSACHYFGIIIGTKEVGDERAEVEGTARAQGVHHDATTTTMTWSTVCVYIHYRQHLHRHHHADANTCAQLWGMRCMYMLAATCAAHLSSLLS